LGLEEKSVQEQRKVPGMDPEEEAVGVVLAVAWEAAD
jgi:hypothetical protein